MVEGVVFVYLFVYSFGLRTTIDIDVMFRAFFERQVFATVVLGSAHPTEDVSDREEASAV